MFDDSEETGSTMSKITHFAGRDSLTIFMSSTKEEIFVILRPKVPMLMARAAKDDFPVLLERDALARQASQGYPQKNIARLEIGEISAVTTIDPYAFIYAKYDPKPEIQHLYRKAKHHHHPFSISDQLKLTLAVLEAHPQFGGAGLNLSALVQKKVLLGYFPLHDPVAVEELSSKWCGQHQWPWYHKNAFYTQFGSNVWSYIILFHDL